MNTPLRWLEVGGNAPHGAAELLSAATPPPAFSDALRYRLAVGVAKTVALPATSVWTTLAAKGAFVAVIGGASGFFVHAVTSKHDAPAALPAPAPVVASLVVTDKTQSPPVAVEALPALELPTTPPDRAPKLKLDARLEEAELLEKARALVGSNPAAALKLTAEHSRDFPKGRLGTEADLLAAQSLLGMGKVAAAKQRAQASLSRYPRGLYARQLREIVEQ